MKEENVVTVKVQMDTSEAEAVIDRLTAKLAKMAEMLKEATPQHGELASSEISASLNIDAGKKKADYERFLEDARKWMHYQREMYFSLVQLLEDLADFNE